MWLRADGETPVGRAVLVDLVITDDGYAVALDRPVFLAAEDRLGLTTGGLTILRPGFAPRTPPGGRQTHCTGIR